MNDRTNPFLLLSALLIGAGAGANFEEKFVERPKVDALQDEMQTYVFNGNGGEVSCNESNDPVTTEKVFFSKDIAPNAALSQLLRVNIAKGYCTVQLKP